MISIIESFLPEHVPVFDTDASHADLNKLPYVLVLGREGVRDSEEAVAGRDSVAGEITVRAVGRSRRQIMDTLERIRTGLDRQSFPTAMGRKQIFVVVEWRGPLADRDVTIPGSGAPVLFADDVYQVLVL